LAPKGQARPVAGGYCVTGQWPFASGCQHASWLLAHAVVTSDGRPRLAPNGTPVMRVAVFPAAQAEIVDTWHVAGLRGTGTHDFRLHETFGSDLQTFSVSEGEPQVRGTIFRIPPLAQLPLLVASVGIGIARGALEDLATLVAGGKKRVYASARVAESAVFQD